MARGALGQSRHTYAATMASEFSRYSLVAARASASSFARAWRSASRALSDSTRPSSSSCDTHTRTCTHANSFMKEMYSNEVHPRTHIVGSWGSG